MSVHTILGMEYRAYCLRVRERIYTSGGWTWGLIIKQQCSEMARGVDLSRCQLLCESRLRSENDTGEQQSSC